MTIQPARHECHACCLLRAGFLAFQPVVDNTRSTSCRAGCIVISENPHGLATHMVYEISKKDILQTFKRYVFKIYSDEKKYLCNNI